MRCSRWMAQLQLAVLMAVLKATWSAEPSKSRQPWRQSSARPRPLDRRAAPVTSSGLRPAARISDSSARPISHRLPRWHALRPPGASNIELSPSQIWTHMTWAMHFCIEEID